MEGKMKKVFFFLLGISMAFAFETNAVIDRPSFVFIDVDGTLTGYFINTSTKVELKKDFLDKHASFRFENDREVSLPIFLLTYGEQKEYVVKVTKKKRQSQLNKDIRVLLKTVAEKNMSLTANEPKQELIKIGDVEVSDKKQQIVVTLKHTVDKRDATVEIKSGSADHWGLGVAMPVTGVDQVTLSDDGKKVVEKNKPGSFYLTIDYYFSDILKEKKEWNDRFALMFMVKASETPMESFGLGLKYEWDTVSPFISLIMSTVDQVESDLSNGDYYQSTAVFGITFNIDKMSEWYE